MDADIDFTHFDNDGEDGIPNSGDDDGLVDYVFFIMQSSPNGFLIEGAPEIAGLSPLLGQRYVSRDIGANGQALEISNRKD